MVAAGTLHDALNGGRLCEDRVRFYVAEIVLALRHLHGMGLLYRDVKPSNVLLNRDGHIQLVDMGGVIDTNGAVLVHEEETKLPLFREAVTHALTHLEQSEGRAISEEHPSDSPRNTLDDDGELDDHASPAAGCQLKRALSIMGTLG